LERKERKDEVFIGVCSWFVIVIITSIINIALLLLLLLLTLPIFLLPPPPLSSSYYLLLFLLLSPPLSPSFFNFLLAKIGLGDTGHGWGAGFKHEVVSFLPSTIDYKFIFPTALVQPVCCY